MNKYIDITRLIKEILWDNSKIASDSLPWIKSLPNGTGKVAHKSINAGYIDYIQGRLIKANLSGDTICTLDYDHNNGNGKMSRIIAICPK